MGNGGYLVSRAGTGAMNFGVHRADGDNSAGHYGAHYWAVGLPDGREVFLNADRVEVNDVGALVVWRDSEPAGKDKRKALASPQLTMVLAPGQWVHLYAASVMDNGPVVVAHLDSPPKY